MPTDTDEALFIRYRSTGDRDAFATLARRHEPALLGLALGILNGRRDAAMDAVQDAWLRVVRSAHTFDGRSTLRTWLYRIVINACKDARAKLSGLPSLPLPEGGGRGEGSSLACDAELSTALASLPPDRRLLLLLCYHRDLTHPQAAAVLGIPLGTLKSRLNATLTQLRTRLREEAPR